MKTKFTHITEKNKKGDLVKYKCWDEDFKDEDTGEVITIARREAVAINGKKILPPKLVFKNPAPVKCFAVECKQDGLVLLDSFKMKKYSLRGYIKELKETGWKGTFRIVPIKVTIKVAGR